VCCVRPFKETWGEAHYPRFGPVLVTRDAYFSQKLGRLLRRSVIESGRHDANRQQLEIVRVLNLRKSRQKLRAFADTDRAN
jgi:hypothetical protein